MSKPEEISDFINHLLPDLKAEMLIATLLESNPGLPGISVAFDGQHKRVWSHDIESASVINDLSGEEIINLHLNRDGIYDLLPEALFHGMGNDEAFSGDEMARQSRHLRAEEKEARLFFQPFENEIFNVGVELASTESCMYRKLYCELFTAMIPRLWKIKDGLPFSYVTRLKKLLPAAYKICGNMNLTAQSLAYVLDEEVKVLRSTSTDQYSASANELSGVTGSSILGTDFIPGNSAGGDLSSLTFMVGPVMNTESAVHIKNGSMDRFLDCFYGYFVPAETDVCTKYIFSNEDAMLRLNENAVEASYLACNSTIQ